MSQAMFPFVRHKQSRIEQALRRLAVARHPFAISRAI